MYPETTERSLQALGFGFHADYALMALWKFENGEIPREGFLKALKELPGLLENLFIKKPSEVIQEDPDFLQVYLTSWYQKASAQIAQLADERRQNREDFVASVCSAIRTILEKGLGQVSEDKKQDLEKVTEIISRLTLEYVQHIHNRFQG